MGGVFIKILDFSKDWYFAYAENEDWVNQYGGHANEPVDLPHDFKIGLKRCDDPFSGPSEGFYPGGIGYYKKVFNIAGDMLSQRALVYFDGVYRMCEVRLNRDLIVTHKGGYTGFFADLTGRLREGENILQVKVNASLPNASRWYTGAGIYRKVTMLTGSIPSIEPWGIHVETLTDTLGTASADIKIKTKIYNPEKRACNIVHKIFDRDAALIATKEDIGVKDKSAVTVKVPDPKPWSADFPRAGDFRYRIISYRGL
ncbi:MAG TPA: hypothetical protein VFD89_02700 [Clostridia bacterium]|nr:hypothetical protein [Clostridia bacterium]